jgi:BirA family biotin operon repressor/biotin-[acetyl-CoA-carboxylase] ligase
VSAAPKLPPGYTLVVLDEVDSSNDEARRRAEAGAPPGTLIWARSQRRGRGRLGRPWSSPPGNLYCSLLLRPDLPMAEAAKLSFVAGLAVGEALSELLPEGAPVGHKWPNDVLVGGRKVAGILLESMTLGERLASLVIGVGVNVESHPEGLAYAVTSLKREGSAATPGAVLEAYLRCFDRWLGRWRDQGFAPVRQSWLARAEGLGGPIEVRFGDQTLCGAFADLDHSGALIIREPDGGRRAISAGEVFLPHRTGPENRVQ